MDTPADEYMKLFDGVENPADMSRLHPDLKPYLKMGRSGIPVLQHPLVTHLLPLWPAVNAQYLHKKPRYDAAVAEGRWSDAVWLLEGNWRLEMLRAWYRSRGMPLEVLRDLLPSTWAACEPDDTDRRFLALWRAAAKPGRVEQRYESGEGWVAETLDEATGTVGDAYARVTVFRGQHTAADKRGIAWTLDESVAEMFAVRFNHRAEGVILSGSVAKQDVLGYVTSRNESEVVVDPKKVVPTGIRRVPVAKEPTATSVLVEDAVLLGGGD